MRSCGNLRLARLTVQGGRGIRNNNGCLTLSAVTVTGIRTTHGVPIYNAAGGNVTLNNHTTVSGNQGQELAGGIWNEGILFLNGNAEVSDNRSKGDGGGITNSGALILNDTAHVSGNAAARKGGGIYNFDGGSVTLNDAARVDHNTAGESGGGIFNSEGTVDIFDDAAVTANTPDDCVGCEGPARQAR